jgi:purine-binding chemotaxis protein CheW
MIDWEEAHRRLAKMRDAQARGWAIDEQGTRRILAERARRLARRPVGHVSEDRFQILEFTLAQGSATEEGRDEGEIYGVEARFVREVAPVASLTAVPGAPRFIGGLVTLRAQILAAIDLRPLLDLATDASFPLDRLIVLGVEDAPVGVLASRILGVRYIAGSDVTPALPTLTGTRRKYLKGIAAAHTALLDAGLLLSDPDLVVQAQT